MQLVAALVAQGLIVEVQLTYWAMECYARGSTDEQVFPFLGHFASIVDECQATLVEMEGYYGSGLEPVYENITRCYHHYFTVMAESLPWF